MFDEKVGVLIARGRKLITARMYVINSINETKLSTYYSDGTF